MMPGTEIGYDIYLRSVIDYRPRANGPDGPPDVMLGALYDGAFASVRADGDQGRIWTRDPATFRALALALTMAADELDAARAKYYEAQRCEGGAEYGHGLSRTTVHAGCCDEAVTP